LLVFVAIPVLILTYRRFPLSNTTYVLAFLFLVLHTAGAHYRYADVPLGFWLQATFSLTRNHFDRIVHLSYGLLLTWPACEILVRAAGLRGFWAGAMPPVLIVAISGLFETLEAAVAVLVEPELGAAYLGTQGDVWDAQRDMALALAGTIPAIVIFARARPGWYPEEVKR
jgi:putative membrane protein